MMIPNYETGGFNTMQNYLSTIVLAEDYAKEFDVPTGSIVPASLFRRLDEPRVRKIVDKWIDYLAIAVFNNRGPSPIRNAYCSAAASAGAADSADGQRGARQDSAVGRFPHIRQTLPPHTNNAGLIGAYYAFETEVGGLTDVPIR